LNVEKYVLVWPGNGGTKDSYLTKDNRTTLDIKEAAKFNNSKTATKFAIKINAGSMFIPKVIDENLDPDRMGAGAHVEKKPLSSTESSTRSY